MTSHTHTHRDCRNVVMRSHHRTLRKGRYTICTYAIHDSRGCSRSEHQEHSTHMMKRLFVAQDTREDTYTDIVISGQHLMRPSGVDAASRAVTAPKVHQSLTRKPTGYGDAARSDLVPSAASPGVDCMRAIGYAHVIAADGGWRWRWWQWRRRRRQWRRRRIVATSRAVAAPHCHQSLTRESTLDHQALTS